MFLAQQAAPAAKPKGGSGFDPSMLIFLGLIFAVFYFLLIRPQKKREQQRKQMLSQVRKGDKVRTAGGVYGEVVTAKEEYLILLIDKETGTTLKLNRAAVSAIIADETEDEEK